MVAIPERVGETTITGKNQISLPAKGMRQLGWEKGDHLIVQAVGKDYMILMRRPKDPEDWIAAYAGKLTGVFGTHEEVLRYLGEERASWDDESESR